VTIQRSFASNRQERIFPTDRNNATDKKLYPLSRRGGISIRWEKLALFVKVIGHQNPSAKQDSSRMTCKRTAE
ncbi:hypothetical protein L0337_13915, partial [candidate division KSB1 bacterium]|nr:hypothetical protein [candidate division KSB1 bacterium]